MTSSYYDSYAVGSALGGMVAGMFVFVIIMMIIAIAIAVINIIGYWKILVKGGKPGWGALIPFYNQYLLCDMVGVNPWWILIVVVLSLASSIPVIGILISLVSFAASIYFMILLNVSLAKSFGKESSYAVGLILLQPIFYLILGLKGEYEGKKPMEDAVMNAINKNNNPTVNNEDTKFCTSCGSKMNKNSKFCPSCGKEVK
ncbi:MAG: zinc ribbon domain-containing protein [Bacilli bacterium]|nr:zinc ribbon domain-containing protein [Bacilli bacterium]